MVSHDQLAPGPMRVEQAQDVVLSHAEGMFERMDRNFKWHFGDYNTGSKERWQVYQDINGLLIERDLPQDRVNLLIGKMVNFEWWLEGANQLEGLLRAMNLNELADELHWAPAKDNVFDQVFDLFPQAKDIWRESFMSGIRFYQQNRQYPISTEPWPITDLFRVGILGFSDQERQIIDRGELANYFIYGDRKFYNLGGLDSTKRDQARQAMKLIMEGFGIRKTQATEVAQSVVEQFSLYPNWPTLTHVRKFLDNLPPLTAQNQLDWQSFGEKRLAKVYDITRDRVRADFYGGIESRETSETERENLRGGLVRYYCSLWYKTEDGKRRGFWELRNYLNQMSKHEFFEQVDVHLVDEARALGERLGVDLTKIARLLQSREDSLIVTQKVRGEIERDEEAKRKKEIVESAKVVETPLEDYEQRLQTALEMLKKP